MLISNVVSKACLLRIVSAFVSMIPIAVSPFERSALVIALHWSPSPPPLSRKSIIVALYFSVSRRYWTNSPYVPESLDVLATNSDILMTGIES